MPKFRSARANGFALLALGVLGWNVLAIPADGPVISPETGAWCLAAILIVIGTMIAVSAVRGTNRIYPDPYEEEFGDYPSAADLNLPYGDRPLPPTFTPLGSAANRVVEECETRRALRAQVESNQIGGRSHV